jgi:hypothetical protein
MREQNALRVRYESWTPFWKSNDVGDCAQSSYSTFYCLDMTAKKCAKWNIWWVITRSIMVLYQGRLRFCCSRLTFPCSGTVDAGDRIHIWANSDLDVTYDPPFVDNCSYHYHAIDCSFVLKNVFCKTWHPDRSHSIETSNEIVDSTAANKQEFERAISSVLTIIKSLRWECSDTIAYRYERLRQLSVDNY